MFTTIDHHSWQMLYERQLPNLAKFACSEFQSCFETANLPSDHIPTLQELNKIFKSNDWTIVHTPIRYLNKYQWAEFMSKKHFPITTYVRDFKDLDFTPEPDIFHDVFGHLPMLLHPQLLELLNLFSAFYNQASESQLSLISQLWWNTIEFGVIKENGLVKAFGAGHMSSFQEICHAVTSPTIPLTLENGCTDHSAVYSLHSQYLLSNSLQNTKSVLLEFSELQKFNVK